MVVLGVAAMPASAEAASLLDVHPGRVVAASPDPTPGRTPPAGMLSAPAGRSMPGTIALVIAALAAAWWAWRRRLYDPVPARGPAEPPMGLIADWPFLLLGGMLVWAAQMLGASAVAAFFALTTEEMRMVRGSAIVSLGAYAAAGAAAAFVLLALPGMARLIRASADEPGAARGAMRAALAFVLVFPIVMALGTAASLILSLLGGGPPPPIAHKTLRMLAESGAMTDDNAPWWAINIAAVVVAAPVVEELIYRGFVQSAIRRALLWRAGGSAGGGPTPRGRRHIVWTAILASSAFFALMHAGVVEPHALITLFALSVCFGVVYERTGTLAAPIVMHVLFNAVNVGLAMV